MFEFNATLLVAMISFVLFMFIMNAIFYRPILSIIRRREEFVAKNYQAAKEMANKADELNNEYQTKLSDAKAKSRDNITKEMESVQKAYSEKTKDAKEKAKIQIQNNKEIIEAEKIKIYEKLDSGTIEDISSEIFKKVMS